MKIFNTMRARNGLLSYFSWGFLFLPVFGCMTIDDLSKESFRDPLTFSEGFSPQKIGILPVMGIGSTRAYLEEASDILGESFAISRQDIEWVLPQNGRQIIDEAGGKKTFEEVTKLAKRNKVPKGEDLKRIGDMLGTPYIIVTTLNLSEITDGASHVVLSSQFWDVDKGEILWKGIGEARGYVFFIFPIVPSNFEKAIRVASEGIIKRFP